MQWPAHAKTRASFLFPPEVVAADSVDLEGNRVALRRRVVLGSFLDRRGQRVPADGFQDAGPRRSANVGDLDGDRQSARAGGAADRACFSLAFERGAGAGFRIR